jgi:hypothetical protein
MRTPIRTPSALLLVALGSACDLPRGITLLPTPSCNGIALRSSKDCVRVWSSRIRSNGSDAKTEDAFAVE